jgi:hypothetical protein
MLGVEYCSLEEDLHTVHMRPRVKGSGRGGRRLENGIVSVLWPFKRRFQLVKYLDRVATARRSLRKIVSGRRDWIKELCSLRINRGECVEDMACHKGKEKTM